MVVKVGDLQFLSKTLKLSEEKTFSLIENPDDFNLILNSICENKQIDTFINVSFEFYVLLNIFKFSKNKINEFEDKHYTAEIVSKFYPNYDFRTYLIGNKIPLEDLGKYYLVGLTMFEGRFYKAYKRKAAPHPDFYYQVIDTYFKENGPTTFYSDLPEWIKILKDIRNFWFNKA